MKYLLILASLIFLSGCKDTNQTEYTSTNEKKEDGMEVAIVHPGKKLLETQCYVCHNPTTPEASRIAPPMVAIKAHYINSATKKADFIEAIQNFVDSPTVEKARMRGAVRKFGVMPYQPFKEQDIKQISEYLFDYTIQEPSWFKDHWQKGKKSRTYINSGKVSVGSTPSTLDYSEIGLRYAMGTKAILGQNLMQSIQQQGTVGALQYCNEKAQTLTDSMAAVYNVQIKRVSDKPRSAKNQANTIELLHIQSFKDNLASGDNITPIIRKETGRVNFYYPIYTNTMCLQCHGKPTTDIESNVLNSLALLYPNDKAVGYGINEVRGIWNIKFETAKN